MKAVLFDLDGVLINTEHMNTKAAVRAMREQGVELTPADKKHITGRNPVDYSVDFAKKYSFNRKKMIQRHGYHWDALYYTAKPFLDARKLLLRIRKLGYKTAVVTSSERETVNRDLKKLLKLKRGTFDAYVTFDVCKKRKPSPLPYLLAARKLKVKPKDCIVIEDSVAGVTAAKRANMKCIAVTNTFPASKLKRADLIVKNLNDKRVTALLEL